MIKEEMDKILEKVQQTTSCHQKCLIVLIDLYRKSPPREFLKQFLNFLKITIFTPIENFPFVKRTLIFMSRFCTDITRKDEQEDEPHTFLSVVIEKVLQWSNLDVYSVRYNSSYFIHLVLQDIGEAAHLEVELIEDIQNMMLDRMQETKRPIRLVAMSALVRLQDPNNSSCPVINAYTEALLSSCAQVRKQAVEQIAPTILTLNKIRDRVRDVDPDVRSMAYHKCADIGPQSFKIADKHIILMCGFQEKTEKVKNVFREYLLSKWLTAFKGDYLRFIRSLKLIADEEDICKMTFLVKELLKEFFNTHPFIELISVLPMNNEKLIDIENLTNEVTLYWNIITELLRGLENTDDLLNSVLPELTPFCHYLENVIKTKSKEKMDEWKQFEYQFDLMNLLEIAANYDFSDEVGRRTMYALVMSLLQNHTFTTKLTKKLVSIAHQCSSQIEFFTNDMCQLISEIREHICEEPISEDQLRERNFKAAELRVKLNVLQEQQNDAIENRDYQKAQIFDNEIQNCKKQLEQTQNQASQTNTIRVVKYDNETLVRCLDILSGVLELPAVTKLTPSLITCRDHFLVPLIGNQGSEPHWRVLRCLGLYSLIDKPTAQEYAKIISIPIVSYRSIPINNVSALVQSIFSVADLILKFGIEIFGGDEVGSGEKTLEQNATKRKLYSNDNEEEVNNVKIDHISLVYIFEIFLDMLDDEREEIRIKTILAIIALITDSIPITPAIFSRLLLKWYNPLTEQEDRRLQGYLGRLIETYVSFKSSSEVIKEAIVPTLTSITKAPKSSPLVDIDVDNMILFFSEIMSVRLNKDDLRILAIDISIKILDNPNDKIVPPLAKLLSHLDLSEVGPESLTELLDHAESLNENVKDKVAKKCIEKYSFKLRHKHTLQSTNNTTEQTNETRNESGPDQAEENTAKNVLREISHNENFSKEPMQIKRRKNRVSRKCVVVLERLNFTKSHDETTLHTILEEPSLERMQIDEDTSSTDSTNSRTKKNNIVTSETSDSDFSNDCEGAQVRRSSRWRKKRIIHSM